MCPLNLFKELSKLSFLADDNTECPEEGQCKTESGNLATTFFHESEEVDDIDMSGMRPIMVIISK